MRGQIDYASYWRHKIDSWKFNVKKAQPQNSCNFECRNLKQLNIASKNVYNDG